VTWRERLEAAWTPARRWYEGHGERDRRIIVGVGIATVLALLYLGIVAPLRDRRARVEHEIDQGMTRIEHAERLVGSLEKLEAERSDLRRRLKAARGRLLPGNSETLGGAALQERANALAAEHGVTVRTTQVLRSEPAEPYRKVAVRLTLSGSLQGIAAMLAGLEYEHELLIPFVEISRRGAVSRPDQPSNVSATMEVAGFVSGEEESPQEAEPAEELPGPPRPPGLGSEPSELVGPPRPTPTPGEDPA
jgi:type II secretory pathway component PulM